MWIHDVDAGGPDEPYIGRAVLALGGGEPKMSSPQTGQSLGLLLCLQCRATVRALQVSHPRCPRCHAHLFQRKPHSLALTAALLLCAAILYVPANLLPVMYTRTIFDEEQDTIMSGVLTLLHSGSWPIAVLVFVASIVVPMLKIIALCVVLFSAWRRSGRYRTQRSELFRMVEFIGRWSMLDVYAISLLVTLVQIRSLAFVSVGWGALAFGAVVVLTLFAARTFDERLLWDSPP
jgi:paraquat-inducible protein A